MIRFEALREQIDRIEPVDEKESLSIDAIVDRLMWPGDPSSEADNEHHVTASAFVVSSRGVILHRHRRLRIWIPPGGHVAPGELPEVAALRETLEETGLVARHLVPTNVLVAPPLDPTPLGGESPEVFWFDFASALARCEPGLAPALAKLGRAYETFDVRE